jgi:heme-degrading monooxygenase HmoA
MKKRLRTIQPPHQSEKFTLEEAIQAWRKVEAEMAAERAARSRSRSASRAPVVAKPPAANRAKVAADHAERPGTPDRRTG